MPKDVKYLALTECTLAKLRGPLEGLYGRAAPEAQKLVRKIADAPNYDFAMVELLDAFGVTEWRED